MQSRSGSSDNPKHWGHVMKQTLFRSVCGFWLAALINVAGAEPVSSNPAVTISATHGVFERAAQPLIKSGFVPLPPGAVEPQGWLRDWAQSAANGITGQSFEWHPADDQALPASPITGERAHTISLIPYGSPSSVFQCFR